jgi:Fe2+ transport system protein B
MKKILFCLCLPALVLILSRPAASAASKNKSADASLDQDDQAQNDSQEESSADEKPSDPRASDKRRLEQYLKNRVAKINAAHKKRMEFIAHEQQYATHFWTKVRDDYQRFSVNLTRQTLDLILSLSSLDIKDHAATISNFEKLQNDELHSFDQKEREEVQEFASSHEAGWKDFVAQQQADRAQFIAEAVANWQQQKSQMEEAYDRPTAASRTPKTSH